MKPCNILFVILASQVFVLIAEPSKYKQELINLGKVGSQRTKIDRNKMPSLYNYLQQICSKNNMTVPSVWLENSWLEKASASEADKGRIYLSTKIIEQSGAEELEGILAHELGHIKHGHCIKTGLINIPTYVIALILSKYYAKGLVKRLLATYVSANIVSNLIIGRKCEVEADRFAFENGKAKGLLSFFSRKQKQGNSWVGDLPEAIEFEKEIAEKKAKVPAEKNIKLLLKIKIVESCWRLFKYPLNAILSFINLIDWVEEKIFWHPHPSFASRIKSAEDYLLKNSSTQK